MYHISGDRADWERERFRGYDRRRHDGLSLVANRTGLVAINKHGIAGSEGD